MAEMVWWDLPAAVRPRRQDLERHAGQSGLRVGDHAVAAKRPLPAPALTELHVLPPNHGKNASSPAGFPVTITRYAMSSRMPAARRDCIARLPGRTSCTSGSASGSNPGGTKTFASRPMTSAPWSGSLKSSARAEPLFGGPSMISLPDALPPGSPVGRLKPLPGDAGPDRVADDIDPAVVPAPLPHRPEERLEPGRPAGEARAGHRRVVEPPARNRSRFEPGHELVPDPGVAVPPVDEDHRAMVPVRRRVRSPLRRPRRSSAPGSRRSLRRRRRAAPPQRGRSRRGPRP